MTVSDPSPFHALVETPLGWVAVMATDRGVRRIVLPRPSREAALAALVEEEGDPGPEAPDRLADLLARLQAYFAGDPVSFDDVPLDLEGRPPFARAVWAALRTLPRGQTITYGELARRVGKPRAARAVGRAMATNPLPIIIPCHRVLGKGNALTGFGGGLDLKAAMLRLEGVPLPGM